jgi:hypothetical protein
MIRERISQELALLRHHYGDDVEYLESGDWFFIPRYPVPRPWIPEMAPFSFSLKPGYPGAEPYGSCASRELRFNGSPLNGALPQVAPPFPGEWIFISWSPEGWFATADVATGSNLWGWARSFAGRLAEGPQ